MKKDVITKGIYLMLILLFNYTAISKLTDFHAYSMEMSKQVFSKPLTGILIYTIPSLEILTSVLLIIPKFRLTGFLFSLILMVVFTGYIILVLTGYFNRIPCACGGVLSFLNWNSHLWFNLFFLALAALGSVYQNQLKREVSDKKGI
jgi:putative oxidoreductase